MFFVNNNFIQCPLTSSKKNKIKSVNFIYIKNSVYLQRNNKEKEK